MKPTLPLAALLALAACDETVTEPPDRSAPTARAETEETVDCALQNNNTIAKLTACVTLDGVRARQAALQAISDANGGTRFAGSPGDAATADYVAGVLEGAGYDVTIQPVSYLDFAQLGPSTLEQIAPLATVYTEGADYNVMDYSVAGDVTAPVTAVDIALGLGNTSTSGCEAGDFVGFPPGHIALLQRGTCFFNVKAENAEAAGAVGVIIFNQGNVPGRTGLLEGTVGEGYAGTLPVMGTTYGLGEALATTPGVTVRMATDVATTEVITANVIAESIGGAADNVVIAGAHLDSPEGSPGINDNGSGVAALLETAVQMQLVRPRNQVRFAFWGGTMDGRRGSRQYLEAVGSEFEDIALYLNFDVIGSPNHAFFVYDSDASSPGSPRAPGSEAIESFFQAFYADRGLPSEPTFLSSDDLDFQLRGIPTGGIYTGTNEVKTPEQAALYGGPAGEQFDPCPQLACHTFDNVTLQALDVNSDAVASAVLQFAMSTASVNGSRGKGNFGPGPDVPPGPPSFAPPGKPSS